MKVWVVNDYSHGEITVLAESTDPLEFNFIKDELSYLEGGYEDERDDFIADIASIKRNGRGRAAIEERFDVELVEAR